MSAWLKTSELKKEDVAVGSKHLGTGWFFSGGSQIKDGRKEITSKLEI